MSCSAACGSRRRTSAARARAGAGGRAARLPGRRHRQRADRGGAGDRARDRRGRSSSCSASRTITAASASPPTTAAPIRLALCGPYFMALRAAAGLRRAGRAARPLMRAALPPASASGPAGAGDVADDRRHGGIAAGLEVGPGQRDRAGRAAGCAPGSDARGSRRGSPARDSRSCNCAARWQRAASRRARAAAMMSPSAQNSSRSPIGSPTMVSRSPAACFR